MTKRWYVVHAYSGMEKAVGNITGPFPTIFTRVRSNIEFNNGNIDIDNDDIGGVDASA